ncbi:uncharacterized protein LOC111542365 [Piliocolobus tephrosceles]|uniref:uncharacterized protein LOC111542365 n=1 Tax=Piliocolobus tephrosceles TaxID=591936 RepID=UPI000E6B1769|nr:uncharacterized protein LOC111542365 [Piliocolobus tephrosceles]
MVWFPRQQAESAGWLLKNNGGRCWSGCRRAWLEGSPQSCPEWAEVASPALQHRPLAVAPHGRVSPWAGLSAAEGSWSELPAADASGRGTLCRFPVAAVTNSHRPRACEQQAWILSRVWRPEARDQGISETQLHTCHQLESQMLLSREPTPRQQAGVCLSGGSAGRLLLSASMIWKLQWVN